MAYEIDNEGSVILGGHRIPVPRTVSREAQAFLASPPWKDGAQPGEGPVAMWTLREFVDAQMKQLSDLALHMFPADVEEMQIGGVRCHLVRPKDMPPENAGKVLMNLHGGGFVLGSGALVEAIPIANLAQVPVIAVDYRLAPEHPFPAATDDAVAVYRELRSSHRPDQIGIYGSSAGGFITGQLIMRLQKEGLSLPACCGVFTAGGDLTDLGDTENIFTLTGFYGEHGLPPDHELSEIRAYVGDADPTDPLVSPERGDLGIFPPTLLIAGTRDALLSATASLHRALRRAGVEAELYVFEAMPHAHWYMLHLPEAREALDVMKQFFLKHLGSVA